MNTLQELCSLPTAPFAEDHVIQYVQSFVARRPKLRLSRDQAGNLLIQLPSRQRHPRWVFTAHMDHPGFIARRMTSPRTLQADFRGYVLPDYVQGAKVRFFDNQTQIPAVVTSVTTTKTHPAPRQVTLKVSRPIAPGSPGMFDQGEGRTRGGKFYSRACDDVAGCAAALTMLDELLRTPAHVPVAVLLTRAEEEGFIGAIAAATRPKLLRKTDRVIAIECSAMQPYAPQGRGVIIRVGDKTSVFNSSLSYFLTEQATRLARKDKTFKFQRALMPGGTCEATVYDVYGFTASSLCVPLGNYHNMNRETQKIGPEYIDLNDWRNMVKLFVHLARTGHEYQPGHRLLKEKVEKRFRQLQHLL